MSRINNNIKNNSTLYRQLAIAGILGPIMFWSVSFSLASLQPGYNSTRQTLSALVLTTHGWIQTLDFCFFGLFIMLFAVGLYSGIQKRRGLKWSASLIFLIGFCILLIGIFPTDPSPQVSLHGLIHLRTVQAVGILFPISSFLLIPGLKADPRWKGFAIYTGISGGMFFLLAIGWIILTNNNLINAWVGLYERIFIANAIIWLEVMALRLVFLPDQIQQTERQIEVILSRGLSRNFWKDLGESAWVIVSKLKTHRAQPARKPSAIEISEYVAFSTLLVIACGGRLRQTKAAKANQNVSNSPVLNPALILGIRGLGKHLGLAPVTNLIFSIVKDEK